MKHHFVIDSSVYLNYITYDKLYRLESTIVIYDLVFYVNEILLDELKNNIPKMLKFSSWTADEVLRKINSFTTYVETVPIFSNSPDPKDNFLFDLALQTYSEVIVTKEKVLLNFIESPIAIHDIKWFKEKFPVEL
jgi:uncharacterized protein